MMDDMYVSYQLNINTALVSPGTAIKLVPVGTSAWCWHYPSDTLFTDKKTKLLKWVNGEGRCKWARALTTGRQRVSMRRADSLIGERVRCSWGDPIIYEGLLDCTLRGAELYEGAHFESYPHWCRVILDDGTAVIVNTSRLNSIEAVK